MAISFSRYLRHFIRGPIVRRFLLASLGFGLQIVFANSTLASDSINGNTDGNSDSENHRQGGKSCASAAAGSRGNRGTGPLGKVTQKLVVAEGLLGASAGHVWKIPSNYPELAKLKLLRKEAGDLVLVVVDLSTGREIELLVESEAARQLAQNGKRKTIDESDRRETALQAVKESEALKLFGGVPAAEGKNGSDLRISIYEVFEQDRIAENAENQLANEGEIGGLAAKAESSPRFHAIHFVDGQTGQVMILDLPNVSELLAKSADQALIVGKATVRARVLDIEKALGNLASLEIGSADFRTYQNQTTGAGTHESGETPQHSSIELVPSEIPGVPPVVKVNTKLWWNEGGGDAQHRVLVFGSDGQFFGEEFFPGSNLFFRRGDFRGRSIPTTVVSRLRNGRLEFVTEIEHKSLKPRELVLRVMTQISKFGDGAGPVAGEVLQRLPIGTRDLLQGGVLGLQSGDEVHFVSNVGSLNFSAAWSKRVSAQYGMLNPSSLRKFFVENLMHEIWMRKQADKVGQKAEASGIPVSEAVAQAEKKLSIGRSLNRMWNNILSRLTGKWTINSTWVDSSGNIFIDAARTSRSWWITGAKQVEEFTIEFRPVVSGSEVFGEHTEYQLVQYHKKSSTSVLEAPADETPVAPIGEGRSGLSPTQEVDLNSEGIGPGNEEGPNPGEALAPKIDPNHSAETENPKAKGPDAPVKEGAKELVSTTEVHGEPSRVTLSLQTTGGGSPLYVMAVKADTRGKGLPVKDTSFVLDGDKLKILVDGTPTIVEDWSEIFSSDPERHFAETLQFIRDNVSYFK